LLFSPKAHSRAPVPAGERLDVGGGVHVRDGDRVLCDPGLGEDVPALGDLLGRGHVGHGAARGQVRQDDLLPGGGEDVGRLGHEVHAAEDDVLRLGPGRGVPRELEGVSRDVGELDDLVALVVVPEYEDPVAELLLRGPRPLDQVRVGGSGEVSGALDAAFAPRVGPAAEEQQCKRRRLNIQWGGHGTHASLFSSAARASPRRTFSSD
jgi:hypothetical protein